MRRPLYGWLLSDAISLTGTRISMIAIPWFVLTTTGSVTQTGLVAFAEMLPLVVAKVLGGPVIDHLGARRVAITCDVGSFFAVGLVPLLHWLGWLNFPLLLVLVAMAGALRGPGDAAKDSLTPAIVASAEVPTERATGLSSAVERSAGMVGFALAGALIVAVGPTTALVVDAVSFLVGGAVLAWATVGLPRPDRVNDARESPMRFWRSLHQGWTFLRHEPVLFSLSVMIAVTNLLDAAWATVLAPVWAIESGNGAGFLGLMFAVFAGCSAAGSLFASAYGARLPRFRTYLLAYLVCGLPRFSVMAADSPLWLIMLTTVIAGVASGFLNPILGAVFYERIPLAMVGRVSSLSTSMCYALMPFGGLVGAALITGVGLSPAFIVVGVAYLATTMAPAFLPSFRGMNRKSEHAIGTHTTA